MLMVVMMTGNVSRAPFVKNVLTYSLICTFWRQYISVHITFFNVSSNLGNLPLFKTFWELWETLWENSQWDRVTINKTMLV